VEFDNTLLRQALTWIVGGGGAAAVTYWLLENVSLLVNLSSEYKRYVSIALVVLFAWAAYGLSIAMTYEPKPGDFRELVESLVAIGGLALGIGQVVHGRLKLRK